MIQDLESSNPETNESPAASQEPSQAFNLPPGMGLREINATYEMLVHFKEAIKRNKWDGADTQAVAMGLQMVITMESQYRAHVERLRMNEREALKHARQQIKEAGGQVDGDLGNVPVAKS